MDSSDFKFNTNTDSNEHDLNASIAMFILNFSLDQCRQLRIAETCDRLTGVIAAHINARYSYDQQMAEANQRGIISEGEGESESESDGDMVTRLAAFYAQVAHVYASTRIAQSHTADMNNPNHAREDKDEDKDEDEDEDKDEDGIFDIIKSSFIRDSDIKPMFFDIDYQSQNDLFHGMSLNAMDAFHVDVACYSRAFHGNKNKNKKSCTLFDDVYNSAFRSDANENIQPTPALNFTSTLVPTSAPPVHILTYYGDALRTMHDIACNTIHAMQLVRDTLILYDDVNVDTNTATNTDTIARINPAIMVGDLSTISRQLQDQWMGAMVQLTHRKKECELLYETYVERVILCSGLRQLEHLDHFDHLS